MPEKLKWKCPLLRVPGSSCHWIDIDQDGRRVGKMRARIQENSLIIYSITIFPEFERRGYARRTVDMMKTVFQSIVADRVRPRAAGFWTRMGFRPADGGWFEFRREIMAPCR